MIVCPGVKASSGAHVPPTHTHAHTHSHTVYTILQSALYLVYGLTIKSIKIHGLLFITIFLLSFHFQFNFIFSLGSNNNELWRVASGIWLVACGMWQRQDLNYNFNHIHYIIYYTPISRHKCGKCADKKHKRTERWTQRKKESEWERDRENKNLLVFI